MTPCWHMSLKVAPQTLQNCKDLWRRVICVEVNIATPTLNHLFCNSTALCGCSKVQQGLPFFDLCLFLFLTLAQYMGGPLHRKLAVPKLRCERSIQM